MVMLDTNYVLRFILRDIEEQAQTAATAIKQGAVYVRDEVLAEAVHVLENVYKQDRETIEKGLKAFVNLKNVTLDSKAVTLKGLQYYAETKLDYVDCLLAAFHSEKGDTVLTFDKKLNNLMTRIDGNSE
ncbi:MAG: PIN domain-containing protein [Ruminiclostridium sp.]|nr:PIN domain-containing protein [Ruminiclostridium sp.]